MNETISPPNPEPLGRQFDSLAELSNVMKSEKKEGQDWGLQYLVIHGKRLHKRPPKIEGGQSYYDLLDDPSSSIRAIFHRQEDNRFSMNIYEGQKVVYWFNITNENIKDYSIDIGQVNWKDDQKK